MLSDVVRHFRFMHSCIVSKLTFRNPSQCYRLLPILSKRPYSLHPTAWNSHETIQATSFTEYPVPVNSNAPSSLYSSLPLSNIEIYTPEQMVKAILYLSNVLKKRRAKMKKHKRRKRRKAERRKARKE